ncbi:MAG TPA: S-adenosylmethionine decarboxylase [Candidatus Paceibacterota bacterium]|nr:S-adenosylmethionine decarboxylase [Candidatus Paceibacterota bacterium]
MMRLPLYAYGLLLTFDGYDAPEALCANAALLYRVLEELPRRIGMRPLGEPCIVGVSEPGIAGLSGFRFIMESHISIHTYEERGFVTADIYSCKAFDAEKAARYLARSFGIRAYDHDAHLRGRRFGAPGARE